MALREVLILITFAAAVCGEGDDGDPKKRGAGKGTSLNAIPTGAQKPEYTYSIYSQNPSTQASPSVYQSQVPNSFYPTQGPSQYYQPQPDVSSYPAQPQLNLLPPQSNQFVPLNFVPNPGYQSKYQIIPTKSPNGNIQLLIQPSAVPTQQFFSYPQQYFTPNQGPQQQNLIPSLPQGQFNVAPNYQQLSLGGYVGQPSTMLLLAQPNPSLYNNLVYPNPVQSFYNYYPNNSQAKYYTPPQNPTDYEKAQSVTVSQSVSKEDSDVSVHTNEYLTPPDSGSYKNYVSSRSASYSKI